MKKLFSTFVLSYLKFFAKLKLRQHTFDSIGITGSAGKTSLTQACALILASQFRTQYTVKANSESGIPLHILGLHMIDYSLFDWLRVLFLAPWQLLTYHPLVEVYVMELGIDKPNDMVYLLTIVQPRIGVVLNIGSVHAQAFDMYDDPLEAIAQEKSELIKALPRETGWAILNYDDHLVQPMAERTQAKTIFFSLKPKPEKILPKHCSWLWASDIVSMERGFSMQAHWQGQSYSIAIDSLALGKHFAYTLLAALAVGIAHHIPIPQAINALQQFKLPPGRGSLIPGKKDTCIIDSSYNAAKPAMIGMLDVLASFEGKKKIAVLGDMREIGSLAEQEHREVAAKAVTIADEIVTVGQQMRDFFVPETQKLGFDQTKVHYFLSAYEAASFLRDKILKGGEIILVKGSQNYIFLEIIVKALMLHPEQASTLLCRQEPFWEIKRKKMLLD